MQSLPVTAAPPATLAQAPSPTDNNSAAPTTETFGSVLARQFANTSTSQDLKNPNDRQTASSSVNDAAAFATGIDLTQAPTPDPTGLVSGDMLATLLPTHSTTDSPAAKDKDKTRPQASTTDGASTLPGDMLAMLLPNTAIPASITPAIKDKAKPQASMTDGTSTLPGDMLAMLLPNTATSATYSPASKDLANPRASTPDVAGTITRDMPATLLPVTAATTATNSTLTNEKNLAESVTNGSKKTLPQSIATAEFGVSVQSAENKSTPDISGRTPATGVNASTVNTFAATLASLGKDDAKKEQIDTGSTKISAQPPGVTAMDSLLQNGVAPIAASQSGVAQTVQAVINAPVSHEAWGKEFNQKITWMATQHEQSAELHLNPPNLGPLDVVLSVSGDQATALFTSPHAAVREAVEQALPQLRNMLADNGITLGNAMVSDQSPKDQKAWQADQRQKGNGGSSGKIDATVATGGISSAATASLGRRHLGMVDTFA